MRRKAMLLGFVIGVLAAPSAHATTGERATCEYDTRGSIEPGVNDPVLPAPDGEIRVTGPINCQGRAFGRQMDGREGTMTLVGRTRSGLTGAVYGTSCAYGDFLFDMVLEFPAVTKKKGRAKASGFEVKGDYRYVGETWEAQTFGTIGGQSHAGRAGLGTAPTGPAGKCTPEEPYDTIVIIGQMVLLDTRQDEGTNHDVFVAAAQFVNGGALNAIFLSSPFLYSTVVERGDTITFTNASTEPHAPTACRMPCDERHPELTPEVFYGEITQPGSVWTLDTSEMAPGEYRYVCAMHRFARGAITVRE